jgi:glycine cleavage system H protein
MYPDAFHYSKDHEWVKIEGDQATVGITDFAQQQLGDVVYVEMPEIGDKLEFQQSIGVVESVKAVSDVYSPVSGEVTDINDKLIDKPEILNEDPHGEGWILKMKMDDSSQLEKLMSASDYEKFLEGLEEE